MTTSFQKMYFFNYSQPQQKPQKKIESFSFVHCPPSVMPDPGICPFLRDFQNKGIFFKKGTNEIYNTGEQKTIIILRPQMY